MTFEDSGPFKAAIEISQLLSNEIDPLLIHEYPLTPVMMRHGYAVGGLDYAGSDEGFVSVGTKGHNWSLDISLGPVDSGPDKVREVQQLSTALCSEDHEYSIPRVLNSIAVYTDLVSGIEWGAMSAGVNQVDQDNYVFGVATSLKIYVNFDPVIYEGDRT